jgi:hypothetical protein
MSDPTQEASHEAITGLPEGATCIKIEDKKPQRRLSTSGSSGRKLSIQGTKIAFIECGSNSSIELTPIWVTKEGQIEKQEPPQERAVTEDQRR